jgi:hypothetical protein
MASFMAFLQCSVENMQVNTMTGEGFFWIVL